MQDVREKFQDCHFNPELDLNLRNKLVKVICLEHGCYGVEIWTLRKVDQKWLESL